MKYALEIQIKVETLKKFCVRKENCFRVPELRKRTKEYLDYVCQAGREYVLYGSITDKIHESLNELLFPADMFIKMADASWEISDTSQAESAGVTSEQNFSSIYKPLHLDLPNRWQLFITANHGRKKILFWKCVTLI